MNLPGYDSSRDDTDELVRWVNAPNTRSVRLFAKSIGAEVESVEEISYHEKEGIDYWVDRDGYMTKIGKDRITPTCLCGHFDKCTQYKKGNL